MSGLATLIDIWVLVSGQISLYSASHIYKGFGVNNMRTLQKMAMAPPKELNPIRIRNIDCLHQFITGNTLKSIKPETSMQTMYGHFATCVDNQI